MVVASRALGTGEAHPRVTGHRHRRGGHRTGDDHNVDEGGSQHHGRRWTTASIHLPTVVMTVDRPPDRTVAGVVLGH
jgi:hypothetical protein